MRTTIGALRLLIQEEREYAEALQELFGKKVDFGGKLDQIVQNLFNINKEVEEAHKLAPAGAAKAIVAGIHSDLFNKVAEIRKYVEQLKGMAKAGGNPPPQKKAA